jgi:plastocyanin
MSVMKKFMAAFALLSLVVVFFAACSSSSTNSATGSGATNGMNTVHMNDADFLQHSITIKKGESITLVDDVATTHIIDNGTWDNGNAKPLSEAGIPKVQLQFQGNDTQNVGPFNTAGTFHLYCTIHPNMNLTVIVQ